MLSFVDSKIHKIIDTSLQDVGVIEFDLYNSAEFRGKDNRTQKHIELQNIPSYVPAVVLAVEDFSVL